VGRARRAGTGAKTFGWANPFAIGLLMGLGLGAVDRVWSRSAAVAAAGARAAAPIPPRDWRSVLVGSVKDFNDDHIPTAAAAVTFYILLALFPALSAFVSLYGLVADVDEARRQVLALHGLLPGGAVSVLGDQLARLAVADHGGLGLAFVISLLLSIWSANAGVKALIEALNVAFETREVRGFLTLNLLSLGFTAGAIVLAVVAIVVVAAAPGVLATLGLPHLAGAAALRWPVFLIFTSGVFSLLYRYAPSRQHVRWRWVTPGGCVAALGWMVMSVLFSLFVANFGHYDRTYGSLGAIVGFLTWIWLSLMVLLFGAELNSRIERHRPVG
jgi:membrane protein